MCSPPWCSGSLGVPDDVIVADYTLTHEVLPTIAQRREAREATAQHAHPLGGHPRRPQGRPLAT